MDCAAADFDVAVGFGVDAEADAFPGIFCAAFDRHSVEVERDVIGNKFDDGRAVWDGEMVVAGSDFGAVGESDWGVEFDDREILWCRRCGLGRANNIWHRESENQREDEL